MSIKMDKNFIPKGAVSFGLDCQAGSSGKGKILGWIGHQLFLQNEPHIAVASFMPNAGHTWRLGDRTVMTKMLPSSGVTNPLSKIVLGPDTIIDPARLLFEIEEYGCQGRVYVDPRAAVVRPRHVEAEKIALSRISSTMTGGGYCRAEKAMRAPEVELARDCTEIHNAVTICSTQELLREAIDAGSRILAEIAQGYDLDIDFGLEYPFCTSRHVSVPAELTRLGLPVSCVGRVIGNVRPYPIRVGNTADGYSGDYDGSAELTWDEIARRSGNDPSTIVEMTTVTKRVRRVFEFNWPRFKLACWANDVTDIFFNFSNYISVDNLDKSEWGELTVGTQAFVKRLEEESGIRVTFTGTGADDAAIVVHPDIGPRPQRSTG